MVDIAKAIENWVPVLDFEGLYEVSDLGRVRSLDRIRPGGMPWKGRMMSLKPRSDGYIPITLWKNGEQTVRLVHRVVLDSFVGPRPPGLEVLHGDGNRVNNALDNLSWGTHAQNQADVVAHGRHYLGSKKHCPQGHPYSGDNLYVYPGKPHRGCRECRRAHSRNQARRVAEAKRKDA